MSASDALYRPLKSFVSKRAGIRFAAHGGLRDAIIEMAVEEWPEGCDLSRLEEVLLARLSIRIRQRYGSVVAFFLISVLLNVIVKLVIEWWLDRDAHRLLMSGWHSRAQAPPNV